jgi:hypothetical protein
MMVTFNKAKLATQFFYLCDLCGKRRSKCITVQRDINPWNKKLDSARDREKLKKELEALIKKAKKTFLEKGICRKCIQIQKMTK